MIVQTTQSTKCLIQVCSCRWEGDAGYSCVHLDQGRWRSVLAELNFRELKDRLLRGRKERRKRAKVESHRRQFASEAWTRDEAFSRRAYASYEQYLAHQASKLDAAYDRRADKAHEEVSEFSRSFESLAALAACRNVLCLGARLGAEVRALRDLGYFAVGIDLNPGTENSYVHHGDFHALAFAECSVDAVYTNALDHAFELPRVLKEVHRVLRPEGLFIADVTPGFDEGFSPGDYEATYWRSAEDLLESIEAAAPLEKLDLRDVGIRGRNPWRQAIFRKIGADRRGGEESWASGI